MPTLVPEFRFFAQVTLRDFGTGPYGNRVIATITHGTATGDRISGSVEPGGGDWLLIGADGFGRIDVRETIVTGDGAAIFVRYNGLIEATPAVGALLAGGAGETDFGDQYFFTAPYLETGDERYAWVNTTQFLAQGRVLAGPAVEYEVFRVEN